MHHDIFMFTVCEVYGAWVRDLLNPQRDGLQVDTSSATGVAVTGLSTRRISDVETCMDAIERSQLHRLGNSSKASDRSFVLYMFEINKFLENDSTSHSPTKSKFTVVDFCALDHFFTDPTQLLMKEGTNVGNSIIACHKTIKQVALQKKIAPEAEQTPITRLLLEEFGGNCYTNFLFSMDYLEAKAMNLNLLNFSELLRKIETYPICNDETFFHLVSLVQERASHIGKRAALVEIPTNQKQLLVDLNERINVVIEQNTTMQKELILKERLLLDTQKTQLDLEIEQNLQLEAAENKISDLLDRLAFYEKAENNLNSTCSIQDQKTVNEKLYAQVLQLNVQVAQLEAIIQQTSKDLQASLLKNEELGLEMIALINQKKICSIDDSMSRLNMEGEASRHDSFNADRYERLFSDNLATIKELESSIKDRLYKSIKTHPDEGRMEIEMLVEGIANATQKYEQILQRQNEYYKTLTPEDGLAELRKQVKEFVLNTQSDLERERATLLSRCVSLQQQLHAFQTK
ncbi:hypothetical protein RTP6_003278 [Batrachochytrium dendrobatidis]